METFIHVSFAHSLLICMNQDAYQDVSSFLVGIRYFLLVVAMTSIFTALGYRIKYFAKYIQLQPRGHKLLPRTYRNQ